VYYCIQKNYFNAIIFWSLNRIFDGLDGTIARLTNTQSDFGGYMDIILDFIVYTLVPIALTYSNPNFDTYLALSLMTGSFFVNSASLFYLSALLEKRAQGAKSSGEMTSITMPTALIEGTETVVFFSLFILFPNYLKELFSIFGGLVSINVFQRLWWAASVLQSKIKNG